MMPINGLFLGMGAPINDSVAPAKDAQKPGRDDLRAQTARPMRRGAPPIEYTPQTAGRSKSGTIVRVRFLDPSDTWIVFPFSSTLRNFGTCLRRPTRRESDGDWHAGSWK